MDSIIRKATIKDIPVISMIKVKGWQTAYKGMIDDDYLKYGHKSYNRKEY